MEKVTSEMIGVIVKLRLIERLLVVIFGEKACEINTARNSMIQTV